MHEKLIKNYLRDHDILEAHKFKIDVLKEERTNLLEKFFESEQHFFLDKNNALTQELKNNKPSSSVNEIFHPKTEMLNEIIDKCKTHGYKKRFGIH